MGRDERPSGEDDMDVYEEEAILKEGGWKGMVQ
ncbi:predicted protein [Sclerotinia sclerotiorum 1980 UF-70]|uniref:Uncharacterized protein n=1 Tax=Sclerotinia sclerotiorum (strain ATCC 18683 / 1980 / Ss-1) TaxID=665079 RepID=A7EWC2_SCLS1|nr:predicted protein [Sclerotinia sclerotiorum 1980 UF-70]EDN93764.1 predicted protein [Sclerotinia sclerotiorum 1980 UF-70]